MQLVPIYGEPGAMLVVDRDIPALIEGFLASRVHMRRPFMELG